jgi:hypothetical protein
LEFEGHHNGPSFDDRSSAILKQYGPPQGSQNLARSKSLKFQVSDRIRYRLFFSLFYFGFFPLATIQAEHVLPFSSDHWQVAHYGEESLNTLSYRGYITLDGTTVKNQASITGYMHARFAHFAKLKVNGHAFIQDSWVEDKTEMEGELLAINVKFQNELSCQSAKIVLSHCRLSCLLIKSTEDQEQIVELCDQTEIVGPIHFESARGKILASPDTRIREVYGGVVIRADINSRY